MKPKRVHLALLFVCFSGLGLDGAESSRIKLVRAPNGGIQPQAAMDGRGVVHMIYYQGPEMAGDIFYVRQAPRELDFSKPLRVNSQPGSAIAAGTIRGAQLALGKNNRVHVVWNGGQGATRPTLDGQSITPLLYTRLNDAGTAFEPERNLITAAAGLDGGSAIAADPQGNVYAAWHAAIPGNPEGEGNRAVFIAHSSDEGKTFAPEKPAISKPTGACGCCGMRALADRSGAVYILYRAASEQVNRDEILLISRAPGAEFQIAHADPWKVATCPMSSAALAEGTGGVLAAWETERQVYFARANPKALEVSTPIAAPGSGNRKHPVAIANSQGETLFAWTEGTGWNKGGAWPGSFMIKAAIPSPKKDGPPAFPSGAW